MDEFFKLIKEALSGRSKVDLIDFLSSFLLLCLILVIGICMPISLFFESKAKVVSIVEEKAFRNLIL